MVQVIAFNQMNQGGPAGGACEFSERSIDMTDMLPSAQIGVAVDSPCHCRCLRRVRYEICIALSGEARLGAVC